MPVVCWLSVNEANKNAVPVCRLEREITLTEAKHGIAHRWRKTDAIFVKQWQIMEQKRRNEQLRLLLELARERQFLLEVRKKHTGMLQLLYI